LNIEAKKRSAEREIFMGIQLTPELDRKLREFKDAAGVSKGWLIRQGIVLALEKYSHLRKAA
jgi:hypothetical protein